MITGFVGLEDRADAGQHLAAERRRIPARDGRSSAWRWRREPAAACWWGPGSAGSAGRPGSSCDPSVARAVPRPGFVAHSEFCIIYARPAQSIAAAAGAESEHGRAPGPGPPGCRATSASSAASRSALAGEVRFDAFTRGRYATDASIYQIMPVGVVFPKSADDIAAALAIAARARRAGDRPRRRHVAERPADRAGPRPRLQPAPQRRRQASIRSAHGRRSSRAWCWSTSTRGCKADGLFFPVEPSTASRCTIGGMTGNNSCGARSLRYGKMVDNVLAPARAARRRRGDPFGPRAGDDPGVAGSARAATSPTGMLALADARARRDRADVPEGAAPGRRLQPRRAPARAAEPRASARRLGRHARASPPR